LAKMGVFPAQSYTADNQGWAAALYWTVMGSGAAVGVAGEQEERSKE